MSHIKNYILITYIVQFLSQLVGCDGTMQGDAQLKIILLLVSVSYDLLCTALCGKLVCGIFCGRFCDVVRWGIHSD